MSSNKSKKYELVLEDLDNKNPQVMQKVKGILIGDMELSIPEVQKILESFPLTIKRSESEMDLSVYYKSLQAAGAKVLILKQEEKETEESDSNAIEFKLDNIQSESANEIAGEQKKEEKTETIEEIEFELDLDAVTESTAKVKDNPGGTYELNMNELTELSLKDLENEIGESLQIVEQNIETTQAPAGTPEFSLDLQPAAEVMELIESPALANTPPDSGSWESDRLSQSLISEATQSLNQETAPQAEAALPPQKAPEKASTPPTPPAAPTAPFNPMAKIEASLLQLEGEEAPQEIIEEKPAAPEPVKSVIEVEKAPEAQPEKAKPEVPPIAPIGMQQNSAAVQNPPAVSAKPAAKSKAKAIPADLLIPIVIGGLLLGVVNWFYFSSKEEKKAAAPQIVIPEIPELPAKPEVEEAPLFNFQGELKNELLTSAVKLSANIDKAVITGFELTTPEPPQLTPEEIVRGIERNVWLRKAEAEKAFLVKNEDGSFSGKVPIKMYFEQGEKRDRVIADGLLTIIPSGSILKAVFTVELNSKLQEGQTSPVFSKNENGKFSAAMKIEFILNKTEPVVVAPPAEEVKIEVKEEPKQPSS